MRLRCRILMLSLLPAHKATEEATPSTIIWQPSLQFLLHLQIQLYLSNMPNHSRQRRTAIFTCKRTKPDHSQISAEAILKATGTFSRCLVIFQPFHQCLVTLRAQAQLRDLTDSRPSEDILQTVRLMLRGAGRDIHRKCLLPKAIQMVHLKGQVSRGTSPIPTNGQNLALDIRQCKDEAKALQADKLLMAVRMKRRPECVQHARVTRMLFRSTLRPYGRV